MNHVGLKLIALSLTLATVSNPAYAQEIQWHDAATFAIEGKGWDKTPHVYDRLPASVESKVTKPVWELSKDSAGLAIRFVTDAPSVNVRWSLTKSSLAMPHMPATGVSGVDLYARSADNSWFFVGNGRPHKQEGNVDRFTFRDGGKKGRECLLYLPLYNGTKSLEIGVPKGSSIQKPEPRPLAQRKPIVVYGTSIAQGGCASRPGMAWPAILGRMTDNPTINLGFSGSGRMEPPIGEVLAEIEASLYIIDCIWNMGDDANLYKERIPKLVKSLREKHPETPILFVGQSLIRPGVHPTKATLAQEAVVKALQQEGIKNLHLLPGDHLAGPDSEATVDGVHFSDLGMVRQAEAMREGVKGLLTKKTSKKAD
jgi:lysophospholipase L1-like esterase